MSTTTFEIIEPKDIMAFILDNIKSDNDISNKIREQIIANIFTVSEDYFVDDDFGQHWESIRQKLQNTLHNLCSLPYNRFSIQQKGGMNYNYDFIVTYFNHDNQVIQTIKLEFKNNNTNVKDLIQFLELYDKDCKHKYNLFEYSYAEFYYDQFLDAYLAIDGNTQIQKPDKETYLKYVYDFKYTHPFFRFLYEEKTKNKKNKDKLVQESRTQFIETYASQFNFEKLTEKIQESQTNKIFLLWDRNEFYTQTLDIENIKIVGIKPNSIHKLYFDLKVENFIYDIRVRLNWGNNNGIATPRWKFSFTDK